MLLHYGLGETVVRYVIVVNFLWCFEIIACQLFSAAKQVPLAFGIHKLSILCTVEDEKVSIDDLSEKIEELEDFVSISVNSSFRALKFIYSLSAICHGCLFKLLFSYFYMVCMIFSQVFFRNSKASSLIFFLFSAGPECGYRCLQQNLK